MTTNEQEQDEPQLPGAGAIVAYDGPESVHCDDCQAHIPAEQVVFRCRTCTDSATPCDDPTLDYAGFSGWTVIAGYYCGMYLSWLLKRAILALVFYGSIRGLFADYLAESPLASFRFWHAALASLVVTVALGDLPPKFGLTRERLRAYAAVSRPAVASAAAATTPEEEDEDDSRLSFALRVNKALWTRVLNVLVSHDLIPWLVVLGLMFALKAVL